MATETVCAKCGGTGWIIVERESVSGAERCDCRFQGQLERILGQAQIPPLYQNKSFENFIVPGPEHPMARRELTSILLAVKNFVREFPNEKCPGLLLVGAPGAGKTHLAVAALRKIAEKGFKCLFWNYKELLDSIRAGFDPASDSSHRGAYQAALDAEVLLLDDLGAHRVKEWVEDTVTSIITYRCDNKKPLIATTNLREPDAWIPGVPLSRGTDRRQEPEGSPALNLSPSGKDYSRTLAESIGQRARSRLFEMCTVVKMPLIADYRVEGAQSR